MVKARMSSRRAVKTIRVTFGTDWVAAAAGSPALAVLLADMSLSVCSFTWAVDSGELVGRVGWQRRDGRRRKEKGGRREEEEEKERKTQEERKWK